MTEVTSVVVALLCMLGQVTANSCGVDARPHTDGLCGDRLVRARNNLCFLLYEDYPEHFGKRSVHQDIFSYPVEAFTNMNVLRDDQEGSEVTGTPNMGSKLLTHLLSVPRGPLPRPAAVARRGQLKRADDNLPHIQKRGMVCDCCYNKCKVSILALYC